MTAFVEDVTTRLARDIMDEAHSIGCTLDANAARHLAVSLQQKGWI
jgi:hypothetical protein